MKESKGGHYRKGRNSFGYRWRRTPPRSNNCLYEV